MRPSTNDMDQGERLVAMSPSGLAQGCERVDVGVTTGILILSFLVSLSKSFAILTSEFLVLSPYYSDGTTASEIRRLTRMSVAD